MPDPSIIAASATSWTAIGAAIAGVAALITAAINNRTAWFSWRKEVATTTVGDRVAEPRVLLPTRSYFVDRVDELGDALNRIGSGEIVLAIEGELGIGKSAAAAELAHRLLRTGAHAPSGMVDLRAHSYVWIDGRNGCPSMVDICRQLSLLTGDQSLSAVADEHKLVALRAHLAGNKTVLLLDNLRLADDLGSQRLHEFLQRLPTGSVVIASVNRPGHLPLEASRVRLHELELSHVLELIRHEVARLGLGDAGQFDEAFARRLQDCVGGNPSLIGWFLRSLKRSSQSVDERLAAVERGDGLPELFSAAWAELSEESRIVLAACAFLRGRAIAQQLVTACKLGEDVVSFVLDELIAAGLVVTVRGTDQPNVYTISPGLRRFVLCETSGQMLAVFTERLVKHYVEYFGQNWEDARSAIAHVGAIEALLEELFDLGNDSDLQALFGVSLDILLTLGLLDDRISYGSLAYESAVRAVNDRSASLASAVLSSTHALRGELDQAREALALGLLAAERSGDPGEVARQMRCRGFMSYRFGEPEQALEAIAGAEVLARTAGDLNNLADTLALRTGALWYLGRLDESEAAAKNCLHVCEEIPWVRAIAYPLRDLAEIAIHRGDFARAQELLERARGVAVEYEDRRQLARVSLTEARMHLINRKFSAAMRAASYAQSQALKLGLPPEAQEALALLHAARRSRVMFPFGFYYAWRRPTRLTDAPVGGD
jgi:tetratricopeptide (TPR) repeat protein